jgi:hypothetical protein
MRVVVHSFSKDPVTYYNAGGAHADQYGVLHVYGRATGARGRELRGGCLAGFSTGSWTHFEVLEDLPEEPKKPEPPQNEEVTASGRIRTKKRRIFSGSARN